MNHHIEALVGQFCLSCDEAQALWCSLAAELGVTIAARRIKPNDEARSDVGALPVLPIDGRAIAVEVPSTARARC